MGWGWGREWGDTHRKARFWRCSLKNSREVAPSCPGRTSMFRAGSWESRWFQGTPSPQGWWGRKPPSSKPRGVCSNPRIPVPGAGPWPWWSASIPDAVRWSQLKDWGQPTQLSRRSLRSFLCCWGIGAGGPQAVRSPRQSSAARSCNCSCWGLSGPPSGRPCGLFFVEPDSALQVGTALS